MVQPRRSQHQQALDKIGGPHHARRGALQRSKMVKGYRPSPREQKLAHD